MAPPAVTISSRANNRRVAATLYEVAELLNAKGERFKPQAHANAARAVEALDEDVAAVSERGDLEEIPGVGTHIAAKIREIVETGGLAYLEWLRQELPPGVRELAEVEGIGPKRAQVLVRELGITSVCGLEEAAAAGLGVFLEINAYHSRLDLPDTGCIIAREHGAKFAIGSDAHKKEGLRAFDPGVATARRGWLTAGDVIKTRPLKDLHRLPGA